MENTMKALSTKLRICRIIRLILISMIILLLIQFNNCINDNFYVIDMDKDTFENSYKLDLIINSIQSKHGGVYIEDWQILDYDYRGYFGKIFMQAEVAKRVTNFKVFESNSDNYTDTILDKMQLALDYVNSLPTVEGQEEPNKVPEIGGSLRAKSIYLQKCLIESGVTGFNCPELNVKTKTDKTIDFDKYEGTSGVTVKVEYDPGPGWSSFFKGGYYYEAIPGNDKILKSGEYDF